MRFANIYPQIYPQTNKPLFINVWRPSDVSADAKLPVYVFIHGGGFINGSSNQADMTKAGLVGVSFNYRLGALGFFSRPPLGPRKLSKK